MLLYVEDKSQPEPEGVRVLSREPPVLDREEEREEEENIDTYYIILNT
jgi:hypothetical protein